MSFTVIVGNLWGLFTGEWDGAPKKAVNETKIHIGYGNEKDY